MFVFCRILRGVSQIQRNHGLLVLHSSLMLSPDLKIVPEGVAEVMLSLAREPETRHTSSKHSSGPIIA